MHFLSSPSIPQGAQGAQGCKRVGGPTVGGWAGCYKLCLQTLATWPAEGSCLLLPAAFPRVGVEAEADLFPS